MKRFSIKLPQGESIISASIKMSDEEYDLRLNWSYGGQYYRVRLIKDGVDLPIAGKGLNPGVDILETLRLGIGKLYLEGAQPTLANLSLDNRLVYEPVQETVSN